MTVDKLISELIKIRGNQGGRVRVVVDSKQMQDNCNRVFEITHVASVHVEVIPQADGDGFLIENKDGSTREHLNAVLR